MLPTAATLPTPPPVPLEVRDAIGHVWRPLCDAHFEFEAEDTFGFRVADLVQESPAVLVERFSRDRRVYGGLLYISCERQAQAEGIGGAAFARLLVGRGHGDMLARLTAALLWRIAEQFPESVYGRALLTNPHLLRQLTR